MRGTRRSAAKIILSQDSRRDRLPGKGLRTTLLPFEMDGSRGYACSSRPGKTTDSTSFRPRLPRFLDREGLDRFALPDTGLPANRAGSPIAPDIARSLLPPHARDALADE